MPIDKPAAEVDLDETVVTDLIAAQCPQWVDRRVEFLTSGWDNAIFRLGRDLAVRLPRREVAVPLIEHEQRWLPQLASALPLPIPVPLYTGTPTERFPWPWSVVAWLPGRSGLDLAVDDDWSGDGTAGSTELATALGGFIAALGRVVVPDDPPVNPFRGIPLAQRRDRFADTLDACRGVLDATTIEAIERVWDDALAAPLATSTSWLHGDLHPGNLVVDVDSGSVGVVDFGDICTGDAAGDLLLGWQLFDRDARRAFRTASGVDDATWRRGRGWALAHGLACLSNSADDPAFAALGRHTLAAVVGEFR